jgi:carbonic anhydrase
MTKMLFCLAGLGFVVALWGTPASAAEKGAPWNYKGNDGPAHWGDLSKKFATCKNGKMQSPIDLDHANESAEISLAAAYKSVPLTIKHNGHTVQLDIPSGSWMIAGGKAYKLLQFHFHTASEHVVDGEAYPMEAHFVHAADDGSLAVISVFFVEGTENQALKAVFDHLPTSKTKAKTVASKINPAYILPGDPDFYRYRGSLTTPPCSEGVNWFVIQAPEQASKAQIEAMTKAIGPNARPAQPTNNRLIVEP